MPSPVVAELRLRHAAAVGANRLKLEDRWGQPCLAYNVIISPDRAAARSVCALQQLVLRAEPALLAVPRHALHVSAAWLIPVHEQYQLPKDELWDLHGRSWLAAMTELSSRLREFRLSFHDVVATDAAVVAIGAAPAQVRLIRHGIARLPGVRSVSAGDMAHLTLFSVRTAAGRPGRTPTSAGLPQAGCARPGGRTSDGAGERLPVAEVRDTAAVQAVRRARPLRSAALAMRSHIVTRPRRAWSE